MIYWLCSALIPSLCYLLFLSEPKKLGTDMVKLTQMEYIQQNTNFNDLFKSGR